MRYLLVILTVLFLSSNVYWFIEYKSNKSKLMDSEAYLIEREHIIKQTVPMLNKLISDKSKLEIIELSEKHAVNAHRKIGDCDVVGFHIYKFDQNGKFLSMGTSLDISTELCPENL